MTRSIHTTRSQYWKEYKNKYSVPEVRDTKLKEIKSKLWKKKIIKMAIKDVRRDRKQLTEISKKKDAR